MIKILPPPIPPRKIESTRGFLVKSGRRIHIYRENLLVINIIKYIKRDNKWYVVKVTLNLLDSMGCCYKQIVLTTVTSSCLNLKD